MKATGVFVNDKAKADILAAYDAAIDRWPLPAERLKLSTAAGETFALAFGSRDAPNPPIVLLHGSGSNSSMWLGAAKGLGTENRVYAVDIPGDPGFSAENRLSLMDGSYPRWLAEALAAWLALAFGIFAPESVSGLILLSASGLVAPRKSFMLKALLSKLRGRAGTAALYASLYGGQPLPEGSLASGILLAEGVRPRLGEIRIFDDKELASLRMPVYLSMGDKDVMLRSRDSCARLGALCPGAQIELSEKCGHIPTKAIPPELFRLRTARRLNTIKRQ
jgi:pimeloyl-ACP methyl ester carboxylesterase